MWETQRLRMSIALAMTSSGALAPLMAEACGGHVTVDGTRDGAGGAGATTSGQSGGGADGGGSCDGGAGHGGPPPQCPDGGPPYRTCFTFEQLEALLEHPPMGGDQGAAGAGGGVHLTACPAPALVRNGCCAPAVAGPDGTCEPCCYWWCPDTLCCGRPFLVAGRARVAGVAERSDWTAELSVVEAPACDDRTRAALARAWLDDARMEHASIASFARFTLELLALGGPPELVADSQRASLDEIEHARLCFALAARLGAGRAGPSVLDIAGSDQVASVAESASRAVLEGCIGETVAAVTAHRQLAGAEDEATRRALVRIAADEERHAALAWRFVTWALSVGGAAARNAVRHAFDDGVRRVRPPQRTASVYDERAWRRFGRLNEDEAQSVMEATIAEVIGPCARLLLQSAGRAAEPRGSRSYS